MEEDEEKVVLFKYFIPIQDFSRFCLSFFSLASNKQQPEGIEEARGFTCVFIVMLMIMMRG